MHNKIVPIKHVWECHWCHEYVSNKNKPNIFYDALYGEDQYDPNHPEYSKILKQKVCDCCWQASLYVSISTAVEERVYPYVQEHM